MAQPPADDPELALTLPVVPPVAPPPAEPGGMAASAPWCPEPVVWPPVPTSTPPLVGEPTPNGPMQIFVGEPPASTLSAGGTAEASPRTDAGVPTPVTGTGVPIAVQVQPFGHSLSPIQVVAFGLQEPGNDVIVEHSGAPPSAAGGDDESPLLVAPPVPLGPDETLRDEVPQPPDTFGWQTNASPQSVSALQGTCHLNAQRLRVVVVQVSTVVMTVPASHFVFAAHPDAVPPLP